MLFATVAVLFLAIFLSGVLSDDARTERRRRLLRASGREVEATVTGQQATGRRSGGLDEVALICELDDGSNVRAVERLTAAERLRCGPGKRLQLVVDVDRPSEAVLDRIP